MVFILHQLIAKLFLVKSSIIARMLMLQNHYNHKDQPAQSWIIPQKPYKKLIKKIKRESQHIINCRKRILRRKDHVRRVRATANLNKWPSIKLYQIGDHLEVGLKNIIFNLCRRRMCPYNHSKQHNSNSITRHPSQKEQLSFALKSKEKDKSIWIIVGRSNEN